MSNPVEPDRKKNAHARRPRLAPGKILVTDPRTSARLAAIRQRDTRPEVFVRSRLSAVGARYRVSNRDLPGSPDIANRKRRWAIFVHGCFWHHHTGCTRATIPKRNRQFWLDKFNANRSRDRSVVTRLRKMGFRVLSIWECETRNTVKVDKAIARFVSRHFVTRNSRTKSSTSRK